MFHRSANRLIRAAYSNSRVTAFHSRSSSSSSSMLMTHLINANSNNSHQLVVVSSSSSSNSPFSTTATSKKTNLQLIQKLRKATGAPMVECKKAIAADGVDGDYEKAAEWLRKNGSAKAASKLVGRDASDGLVGISMGNNNDGTDVASIVKVSSETDFASRSTDFSNLVQVVADAALLHPKRDIPVTELLETNTLSDDTTTVQNALENAILAIRENLQIASATTLVASSPNSVLSGYVHGKVFNDKAAGTAAAIVELAPMNNDTTTTTSSSSNDEKMKIQEVGKKLAMHIVAARPSYQSPADVPDEIIRKEKEILMDQMADSGKPPEILEKIVNGRLRKFYEGVCLEEQGHMLEEGNPKVSKVLKGLGLKLVSYECVSIQ